MQLAASGCDGEERQRLAGSIRAEGKGALKRPEKALPGWLLQLGHELVIGIYMGCWC